MSSEPNSEGGGNLPVEIEELRRQVRVCAQVHDIEPDSRYLEVGVSEFAMILCNLWDSVDRDHSKLGRKIIPGHLPSFRDTQFRFVDWPLKVNWDKPSGVSFVDRVIK
jgi:hypothetical protein